MRIAYLSVVTFLLAQFAVAQEASEQKSLVVVPALSLFLPGLGQYLDGETEKGLLLTSYALTGYAVLSDSFTRKDDFFRKKDADPNEFYDAKAENGIGQSMILHAGYLSVYDNFNARVKAYQAQGQYMFLPQDQSLMTIAKAPFRFNYLKRATTWIPFGLAMVMGVQQFRRGNDGNFTLGLPDATAGSYRSYVAGTGEEAMFRGWIFPILYEKTDSYYIANAVQSLGFGYLHGPTPYFQIVAGYYLGWLTHRNEFDMGESIFVHAWWDVFVLTAEVVRSRGLASDYSLSFPLLKTSF